MVVDCARRRVRGLVRYGSRHFHLVAPSGVVVDRAGQSGSDRGRDDAFGTGVLTAEERGWIDWGWVAGVIGVVAPLWSVAVWLIHRGSTVLARVDLWWRSLVAVGVWVAAISSLASDDPIGVRWLAVKLVCFAVVITSGIVIRFVLRPFSVAFGQILAEGSTPEREAIVAGSIRRAQPFVVVIWASLLVAAAMAVAQPTL